MIKNPGEFMSFKLNIIFMTILLVSSNFALAVTTANCSGSRCDYDMVPQNLGMEHRLNSGDPFDPVTGEPMVFIFPPNDYDTNGPCPFSLFVNSNTDPLGSYNVAKQAMFSLLREARASGLTVNVAFDQNTCKIVWVYFNN